MMLDAASTIAGVGGMPLRPISPRALPPRTRPNAPLLELAEAVQDGRELRLERAEHVRARVLARELVRLRARDRRARAAAAEQRRDVAARDLRRALVLALQLPEPLRGQPEVRLSPPVSARARAIGCGTPSRVRGPSQPCRVQVQGWCWRNEWRGCEALPRPIVGENSVKRGASGGVPTNARCSRHRCGCGVVKECSCAETVVCALHKARGRGCERREGDAPRLEIRAGMPAIN
jgi:hypothetical protein